MKFYFKNKIVTIGLYFNVIQMIAEANRNGYGHIMVNNS